jgi:hypothetical protein
MVRTPFRFAPQVTPLEDRTTPATVPFQETLTLVGQSDTGVLSYVGHATQFGRVTATLDVPNGNRFVKVAANGDTAFGFVTHASPTTGSITLTGGTGRFTGITGDSTYVIRTNGGTTTVSVTGTLDKRDTGGGQNGSVTVPFSLTGGGPAPFGLPLFPGGSAGHSSTGVASLLGNHTGAGTFNVVSLDISATGAVTGTFSGNYTFTAANGDKLVMNYGVGGTGVFSGQLSADGLSVTGVVFDAMFVVDSAASTGRFEGATGSFRMIARSASISLVSSEPGYTAPFEYTWQGDGVITLARGRR